MRYLGIMAGAILLVAADAPAPPTLDWMTGAWIEQKGERWTEEYWTAERAGIQMGSSRSGKNAALEDWEFMRIVPDADGRLVYLASPAGRASVPFRLIAAGDRSVTFENPAHDYPKRIRYWREGRALNAEISGANGANAQRWSYRPMGG